MANYKKIDIFGELNAVTEEGIVVDISQVRNGATNDRVAAVENDLAQTKEKAREKLSELSTAISDETDRAQTAEQGLDERLAGVEGKIPEAATASNKLTDKKYVDDAIKTVADSVKTNADNIAQNDTDIQNLQNDLAAIEEKIPTEASKTNQLADKKYVDDSVSVEKSRAERVENELDSRLDDAESGITALEGRVSTNEKDIDAIEGKIPSAASATNQLADKKHVSDAIAVETARAQAAEKANADNLTALEKRVATNENDIDAIEGKIPSAASTTNQLADKAFVNSTLNSLAAYYITADASGSAFATKAALTAATTFYSGGAIRTPTRNDYCIVLRDESHVTGSGTVGATTRYIYDNGWQFQYVVNNSPFTDAQQKALDSGITAEKIADMVSKTTTAQNTANAAMPKAGGTFTGLVTLSEAPTADLHAATKKYVDDKVAGLNIGNYVKKAGDTMSGSLTLPDIGNLKFSKAVTTHNTSPSRIVSFNSTHDALTYSTFDEALKASWKLYPTTSHPLADPNELGEAGFYYVAPGDNSRMPPMGQVDGATSKDYRLISNAGSTGYGWQMAVDSRSNDMFVRFKPGTSWQGWTSVVKLPMGVTGDNLCPPDGNIAVFDGTKITASGKARNATIKNSGVNINSLATTSALGNYLLKSGGTMTGFITLHAAPTANMHAATKKYVDDKVGAIDVSNYVKKAGDTMTGNLIVPNLASIKIPANASATKNTAPTWVCTFNGNSAPNGLAASTVSEVVNAGLPTRLKPYQNTNTDANSATESGFYYVNSTANRPPFSQSSITDYRILATGYGTTWCQQIATDFRCNDMFIRRNQADTTGGVTAGWQPWTAVVRMKEGVTGADLKPAEDVVATFSNNANATIKSSGVKISDLAKASALDEYILKSSIRNITSKGHCGWASVSEDSVWVPSMNTIAYWNGAYNLSNSSNLIYCSGGTICCKEAGTQASPDVISGAKNFTGGFYVGDAYFYYNTDNKALEVRFK